LIGLKKIELHSLDLDEKDKFYDTIRNHLYQSLPGNKFTKKKPEYFNFCKKIVNAILKEDFLIVVFR